MKYKTEIIMLVIIFSIITILEVFTCKNTDKVLEKMTNDLNSLKEEIVVLNFDNNKIDNIHNYWKDEIKVLALYIEHDELEKVSNVVTKLDENISSNQKDDSLENIEEIKFLLEHIKNKTVLSIQNVF